MKDQYDSLAQQQTIHDELERLLLRLIISEKEKYYFSDGVIQHRKSINILTSKDPHSFLEKN